MLSKSCTAFNTFVGWSLVAVQELDFEQKISKLCHEFPAVHITEVTQLLSASDGSYDGAFAFLLMQLEERDAEVCIVL